MNMRSNTYKQNLLFIFSRNPQKTNPVQFHEIPDLNSDIVFAKIPGFFY